MDSTLKKNDWQSSMRRNYRTKLGLGYDEAKFNYLNSLTANFLVLSETPDEEVDYGSFGSIANPSTDSDHVLLRMLVNTKWQGDQKERR